MEHKQFHIEELKAEDDSRRISGYGSVFKNVDQGGDIVLPGAFVRSLKSRKPAMLWQHDTGQIPGVWDVYEEKERGLYLEGTFADTPLGHEAYTLAKMGALTGLSIGFGIAKDGSERDDKTGRRRLKDLELYEVSLVTFPMNEKATITRVKNADGTLMTEREIEEYLRDGGLSWREAKAFVAGGYKEIAGHRDGEGHDLAALSTLFQQFKI